MKSASGPGWPSLRAWPASGKPARSAEASAYRRSVLEAAVAAGVQPVLDRGVSVSLVLRPKLTRRGQASKVRLDLDNCIKVALDALIGIAYDDAQVVELSVSKRYSATPGVMVEVRPA
jgi:crossover junction endodeoxyribonuclease RusA